MNLNRGLEDLVAVALVAALAPLVVAVLPGPRIPQVVIFLVGGVLIGPHVLGLAETSNIQLLANIGLGFLFLLAGYELDPLLLRQRPGELAIIGWLISAVIAVGVTGGLGAAGDIKDYVPVGLALTTTALGTLLPILRDNDMLAGRFGQHVFAAGAVGELFPILIIAVFLTQRGHFIALASVALVGVLALVLSAVPWLARNSTVQRIIREGQDATGQTTLRWTTVLLFALLAVASRFGLDVVLGAMLAGIGAARLDPPVQHRHHRPGAQVRCGRLRDLHPDLLHRLRYDPRPEGDQPGPAAPAPLLRAAADRPRPAVAAGVPASCRSGSGWR